MRSLVVVITTRSLHRRLGHASRSITRIVPVRALSSQVSRSSHAAPALLTGWDARCEWLVRMMQRLPRLVQYADKSVFAPSLSPAHHAVMFVALNGPQRFDFDVPQFLAGAAEVTKQVLEDASEESFVRLARESALTACNPTLWSPTIRRMRDYCLPVCFEQLRATVQRQMAQSERTQTLEVDVESAYLSWVQYDCLSERPSSEDISPDLRANDDTSNLEIDTSLSAERLQLQVEVRTIERLLRTRHLQSSTTVAEMLQRNVYVARFTSLVSNPDQLDWRLASIAKRTKGKPVEVSNTSVLHRPAIQ